MPGYYGLKTGIFLKVFFQEFFSWLDTRKWLSDTNIGLALSGYPVVIGDAALPMIPNFDHHINNLRAINNQLPGITRFWDGTISRDGLSAVIHSLMKTICDRPVLLVGPGKFSDFSDRTGLGNFQHLMIPDKNTHTIRKEVFTKISAFLEANRDKKPVVLIQSGGALAFWFSTRLALMFPEATLLDMGQALNVFLSGTGSPQEAVAEIIFPGDC